MSGSAASTNQSAHHSPSTSLHRSSTSLAGQENKLFSSKEGRGKKSKKTVRYPEF
jgi:hypothetical protein